MWLRPSIYAKAGILFPFRIRKNLYRRVYVHRWSTTTFPFLQWGKEGALWVFYISPTWAYESRSMKYNFLILSIYDFMIETKNIIYSSANIWYNEFSKNKLVYLQMAHALLDSCRHVFWGQISELFSIFAWDVVVAK